MSLEDVKTLTGVDNDKITLIYNQLSNRLLHRLKRVKTDLFEVPEELEYIVTECAIARYNRLGSEGMTQESMDGHSASYEVLDLSDFESEISDYLNDDDEQGGHSKRGRVVFF